MAPRRRREGRQFLDSKLLSQAAKVVSEIADKEGVEIALLGGAAMQFYGSPRLTGDIDFVADKTLPEAGQLKETGMLAIGGKKYVIMGQVPVDLIVREDEFVGLYQEALEEADETDEGFLIVSPEHLAAIKFSTQRTKDDVDLMWLLAQKDLVDIKKVEEIVRRHLGGKFAVHELRQVAHEVIWRSREGEFDDKDVDDRAEEE
jgi:hypothetical protein